MPCMLSSVYTCTVYMYMCTSLLSLLCIHYYTFITLHSLLYFHYFAFITILSLLCIHYYTFITLHVVTCTLIISFRNMRSTFILKRQLMKHTVQSLNYQIIYSRYQKCLHRLKLVAAFQSLPLSLPLSLSLSLPPSLSPLPLSPPLIYNVCISVSILFIYVFSVV